MFLSFGLRFTFFYNNLINFSFWGAKKDEIICSIWKFWMKISWNQFLCFVLFCFVVLRVFQSLKKLKIFSIHLYWNEDCCPTISQIFQVVGNTPQLTRFGGGWGFLGKGMEGGWGEPGINCLSNCFGIVFLCFWFSKRGEGETQRKLKKNCF